MAWIGNTPSQQQFVPAVDYFSGNGSTTAFTLTRPVASVLEVEAVIENVPQKPSDAYTISGNTITFTSAPPAGSYNIYVRYTSPITQVIAPAQDSVGTAQLVNGAVTTAKMANGGAELGMRNRVINGAMMIDQRNAGSSLTLGSGTTAGNYLGYPVDRFVAQSYSTTSGNGAAFTAQRNAGTVTPPAGFKNYVGVTVTSTQATLQSNSVYRLIHRIEGNNVADLNWGSSNASSVTIGFWVRSSVTGTFGGTATNAGGGTASWRVYGFTFTINAANTWEYKTVTIAGDQAGTWLSDTNTGIELSFTFGVSSSFAAAAGSWTTTEAYGATGTVNLMATNGATFYLTGVQLERGSSATAFDFRNFGAELALCQRYFQSFGGNASFEPCGIGQITASTQASIQLHLPVALRAANPAIGVSNPNHWYIGDAGVGGGATGITLDSASLTMVMLFVDKSAAGFTAGRAARMFANSTTSARLTISSEL